MEKRDQILQAAIECFTNYGYGKTSMSDIGRMVGMNKASLYYHFKDKLALYAAVVENLRTEHKAALRIKLKDLSPEEKIVEFLKSEIDFSETLAFNYLSGSSDHHHNKEETSSVLNSIVQEDIITLRGIIDEAVSRGSMNTADSLATAKRIMMVAQGILLVMCPLDMPMAMRKEGYGRVKVEIENVTNMILKGLVV